MGFTIAYKRLFTVRIDHGYFLNQGLREFSSLSESEQESARRSYAPQSFLEILPTADTAQLLRGRKLVFRQNADGFYVGVQIQKDAAKLGFSRPEVLLDAPLRLTFLMRLKDNNFFNYTALPIGGNRFPAYYFSNEAGNVVSGVKYLSRPVPGYNPALAYEPGSLTAIPSGTSSVLYEAVRLTGPGPRIAADWLELPAGSPPFVSGADRVSLLPAYFNLDLPSNPSGPLTLKLIRPGSSEPDFLQTIPPSGAASVVIDLRKATPGRYDFRLENASGVAISSPVSGPCYVDQALSESRPFGMIEWIHRTDLDQGAYACVSGADQELLSPEFVFSFKNRTTFWRYIFNREQSQTDAQLGDFIREGGPAEKKRFHTATPFPLTKALIQVKKFNTDTLLPNPGISMIKPDPADHQIYSEIYINS
ncbi:MAG: hypothetical protein R3D00_16600 [Bacteroidia bacterium]